LALARGRVKSAVGPRVLSQSPVNVTSNNLQSISIQTLNHQEDRHQEYSFNRAAGSSSNILTRLHQGRRENRFSFDSKRNFNRQPERE